MLRTLFFAALELRARWHWWRWWLRRLPLS